MPVSRVALEDDQNVSNAVVEAVAQEKGVSPTDLQTPLHHVVDADALNALFRPKWSDAADAPRVTFTYSGCEVTVSGQGEVTVRPLESEREQVA